MQTDPLAVLAVLSDTGLRREEVVNVLEKNVDLDGQMVRVFSDKVEEWPWDCKTLSRLPVRSGRNSE
jgi:hypothetical protein